MYLVLKKIMYHREKDKAVPLDQPQALLMVSDLIGAALANNALSAEIEVKE